MPPISNLVPRSLQRRSSSRLAAGLATGAALAAGTALVVRLAARRAEDRHPPTGRFVEAGGVRLHYLDLVPAAGTGDADQPVVLLHGNGATARDFVGSGLADELTRRGHRVVAFDRPGFGYSQRPRRRVWTPAAQADVLAEAFARLGLERPVVVGHSWGALVALALAAYHPDAVRGLLVASGVYYPTPRLDPLFQSPPAIPVVGDVMRYTISPLLGLVATPLFVRAMFAPQPVPDAFWREVPLGIMLRPWQLRAAAAEAALMVPAAAALASHYGQLRLPVTVAAGTDDHIASYRAHASRLHRELPDSREMLIFGVGHMLHYAIPEQLALAVDELFSRSRDGVAAAERPASEPVAAGA